MEQAQSTKKILVAEDEQDLREALVTALETMGGFEVISVNNGEDALTEAFAHKPDYILLDILMPKLAGDNVLQQIREDATWGARVPVGILTAQSDLDAMSHAMEIGGVGTGYFLKSELSLARVVEIIQTKLSGGV